jgi:tetratricopeptide (TPR) repeat protein
VNTQQDIMSVCLAVVRGQITPEAARAAILARTSPAPINETLHLDPALVRDASQLDRLDEKDREQCLDLFKELYDSTPAAQVLEEDGGFGRMLIDQHIVAEAHVDECLSVQRRLHEAGCSPLPRLGELLLRRGFLLPGQVDLAPTRKMPTTRTNPAPSPSPPSGLRVPDTVRRALENSAERFGRYVRVSLLGQGGAGEVWKCWDTVLERWVALKFLKFEDSEELGRLRREAQTAARLSHPNIAAVFEISEANDRTFLVMEFIDGQTLASYPRKDHRKLVSLMREVAQAVQYAHDQGVIHRDIKPGNIMVDSAGRAFIMDFGLARHINSDRTQSEYILGTPSYMSPEQARGAMVDARSDVYSIGATLYELLSDRPPFRGKNALETLEQVVTEDPRPLDGIAADLQTIVFKCLMKEPARRYARAAEVAEEIRRWQEGEAITAHPPSMFYRLGKKIAKRRAVLTVGAVGILLVSAAAGLWLKADREHARKDQELALEKESRAGEARKLALARPFLEEARRTRSRIDRLLMTDDWTPEVVRDLTEKLHGEVDRALEYYPDYPDALLEKARTFMVERDRTRALDYYTKTITATSGYTTAYLSRARILLDQFEDQRHTSGSQSETASPEMAALAARIRSDLQQVDAWSKDTQELSYKSAALAVLDGQFEKAARIFEEYARESRTSYRGWEWAAHCWLHVPGMAEKAIRDLSESIKLRPRYAGAWASRGKTRLLAWTASTKDLALADFRKALELEPTHLDAFMGLGELWLLAGDPGQAIENFTRASEVAPQLASPLAARARARLRMRDNDGALADAEEALKRGTGHPAAMVIRGRAKCSKGDIGGAQADFEAVASKHPRHAPAYAGLGGIFRERGNPARAVAEYDKAIALDPLFAEAFHQRGNAARDQGRMDQATADLNRAVFLDPTDPFLYLDRGVLSCDRGAWAEAQADFRQGLALRPSRPDWFWQRLWLARTKAGEPAQALEELRTFVQGRAEGIAGKLAPKINDLLLGRTTEAEFLALLERDDFSRKAIAEGYFFAAEKALADGRKDRAVELLKRCVGTGALTTSAYASAEAELKTLSGR